MVLNINIVLASLGFGGTETFVIKLANELVSRNIAVTLYVYSTDTRRSNLLKPEVNQIILKSKLKKFLSSVALSLSGSPVWVFGVDMWPFFSYAKGVLYFERTDFRYYSGKNRIYGLITSYIRLCRGDKIVFQSESFLEAFNKLYTSKSRLVLHNFSNGNSFGKTLHINSIKNVIWVGRFSAEKNPSYLISERFIEFMSGKKLHLFGEGDSKPLIMKELIANKIDFRDYGIVESPFSLNFKEAVAILPSKFEGVSNTFLEALDSQIPVFINPDLIGLLDYINLSDADISNMYNIKGNMKYKVKKVNSTSDELTKILESL